MGEPRKISLPRPAPAAGAVGRRHRISHPTTLGAEFAECSRLIQMESAEWHLAITACHQAKVLFGCEQHALRDTRMKITNTNIRSAKAIDASVKYQRFYIYVQMTANCRFFFKLC